MGCGIGGIGKGLNGSGGMGIIALPPVSVDAFGSSTRANYSLATGRAQLSVRRMRCGNRCSACKGTLSGQIAPVAPLLSLARVSHQP